MELNESACYRALTSRDVRFDGKFFIGVTTTGIYCRPICPAPTALRKNCLFFHCASSAEAAGFRPCLRCFPECSPNYCNFSNGSDTLSRALKLIETGILDDEGVNGVVRRLGISSRHLRRLFADHLGTTPIAVARTRRMQIAKRLIDETRLNMTQIAFASGFQTIRQFNGTFRKIYGKSPRELRRARPDSSSGSSTHFHLKLPYRPPLDWSAILDFLKPRLLDGIEEVEKDVYRRRVFFDQSHAVVEVSKGVANHLRLHIPVSCWTHVQEIIRCARRLFDLDADPQVISAQLRTDRTLAGYLNENSMVRVPGSWVPFETSIRAILGQQVSVAGATTLCRRLIQTWGYQLGDERLAWVFPSPAKLARAQVARIGIPESRALTIGAFSKAVEQGSVMFDSSQRLEDFLAQLTRIPGIGSWTANYIAMRAVREPDAFPAGDLGLRKALSPARQRLISEKMVLDRAEAWRPWRSYAAMVLWRSLT